MPRREYWIYVKCVLCKVELGELPSEKELDGKTAYSMCPMCVARKLKGRKHAYLILIPGGAKKVKPEPKKKAKKRRGRK